MRTTTPVISLPDLEIPLCHEVMRMQVRELREPRLVGQRAEVGATSATRASVRARARLERDILGTDDEPDERVQRRPAQLK